MQIENIARMITGMSVSSEDDLATHAVASLHYYTHLWCALYCRIYSFRVRFFVICNQSSNIAVTISRKSSSIPSSSYIDDTVANFSSTLYLYTRTSSINSDILSLLFPLEKNVLKAADILISEYLMKYLSLPRRHLCIFFLVFPYITCSVDAMELL